MLPLKKSDLPSFKIKPIYRQFKGSDILSADQFNQKSLAILFAKAKEMEKIARSRRRTNLLTGNILATLFYEPSTRTRLSFESAMHHLGGAVISESGVQFSSVAKGEQLPDTIRVVENYTDVIALRHPEVGAAKIAAQFAQIPIINAGDGVGEHPTQALLDLYTIKKECRKIDGLTVTMLGDLKYGRTVHSLSRLLSLYKVKINLVSPSFLKMPESLVLKLKTKGVEITETDSLKSLKKGSDVLYVTRVQKERMEGQELPSDKLYVLTPEIVAKSKAIVMHPLPRVGEIPFEIDRLPQAAYFRQVQNGLFIRMALLSLILRGN